MIYQIEVFHKFPSVFNIITVYISVIHNCLCISSIFFTGIKIILIFYFFQIFLFLIRVEELPSLANHSK